MTEAKQELEIPDLPPETPFDVDGANTVVKIHNKSINATAEVTLSTFNELYADKGWAIIDDDEAPAVAFTPPADDTPGVVADESGKEDAPAKKAR